MPSTTLRAWASRLGLLLSLMGIGTFLALVNPYFLTWPNLINVLRQISINGILAIGVTYVLLTGGVDLSLGSLVALTGVTAACVAHPGPFAVVAPVGMGIAVGAFCGTVNGFILNPCEQEGSSPAVDKAHAAGIPIVNVNSETRSTPTAFVGSRDEDSARLAMEYIAERLNGRGHIVMMQGYMGQTAQSKRRQGALEILSRYPGLDLLAEQSAEWDRAKAMTLMENWIQSYGGKIGAVFAQNDEMGMGALIALEQAGLKQRIVVVGVDAIADALQAVKDGRLDATVFQDARKQGETAVETALRIIHKQPYESQVYIPFQLVTRENINRYLH